MYRGNFSIRLVSLVYAYDAVENMNLKHHEGSQPMTMLHDAAKCHLTVQDGPTRVTFTFDNNGPRIRTVARWLRPSGSSSDDYHSRLLLGKLVVP